MCHTRRKRGGVAVPVSRHRGVGRPVARRVHAHRSPPEQLVQYYVASTVAVRARSSCCTIPPATRAVRTHRANAGRGAAPVTPPRVAPRAAPKAANDQPQYPARPRAVVSRQIGRLALASRPGFRPCRRRPSLPVARPIGSLFRPDGRRARRTDRWAVVSPRARRMQADSSGGAAAPGGFSGVHASRWGGAMQACTARMAPAQADTPPRAAVPATCPPAPSAYTSTSTF